MCLYYKDLHKYTEICNIVNYQTTENLTKFSKYEPTIRAKETECRQS